MEMLSSQEEQELGLDQKLPARWCQCTGKEGGRCWETPLPGMPFCTQHASEQFRAMQERAKLELEKERDRVRTLAREKDVGTATFHRGTLNWDGG